MDIDVATPRCLAQRFQSWVWSCLDADLTRSALFFAERYFAINQQNHDARHLYATALLREGQIYSALSFVNLPREAQCSGCLELQAKCSTALGRYRQAHEALDECLKDPEYMASSSQSTRSAKIFPDEAALLCRAGNMAIKGNLHEKAIANFRQALALNPFVFEAFEGLCYLGAVESVDSFLPPRPPPLKRSVVEEHQTGGFFTPANNNHTVFDWKPSTSHPQAFRIAQPHTPFTTDSPMQPPDTFQQLHRATRSQPTVPTSSHPAASRPLSSADETGPVTKKLRSASRQQTSSKPSVDESSKKPSKLLPSGKSNTAAPSSNAGTRRSSRLLGTKHAAKASTRERRRPPPTHARSRSIESEMEEDACSPSPSSIAHSPRSDRSPTPPHINEQAAQEAYEMESADHYIYDLMRRFAIATHALATYDSQKCRTELEQLPQVQQQTPWVLAMIGRAHYELSDYPAAERVFQALRIFDPCRMWDMEVYSTLLWFLQRNVELSYLAQELLNIDPRAPQTWIAIGNLFSLQKERPQALTCFRRAFQLDPSCAYAYTLTGHETVDEDPDKAINFFQSALRVDARHYNAWYGLGTCYLRMSKLRLAEFHFRKAIQIHPNNPVLIGCVGLTLERRGDRNGAIQLFSQAVHISPDNALSRYRRAKLLLSMRKYEEAIRDLEHLRTTNPEEANVVFQLTKAYRLVGDEIKATHLLAVARDIAPKNLNKIKKLLDTVKDESIDDKMDEG